MKEFSHIYILKNTDNTISFDIMDISCDSLGLYNFTKNTYYGLFRKFMNTVEQLENETNKR